MCLKCLPKSELKSRADEEAVECGVDADELEREYDGDETGEQSGGDRCRVGDTQRVDATSVGQQAGRRTPARVEHAEYRQHQAGSRLRHTHLRHRLLVNVHRRRVQSCTTVTSHP